MGLKTGIEWHHFVLLFYLYDKFVKDHLLFSDSPPRRIHLKETVYVFL